MRRLVPLLALAAASLSACAHYDDDYGYRDNRYDYAGHNYRDADFEEDLSRLDPWLDETDEGRDIAMHYLAGRRDAGAVRDLNIRFRRLADADRDLRLTDAEIRAALTRCADHGFGS